MILTKKTHACRIGLLAFCLFPISGFAQMYKWVDEEGNTHYSQQPPPAGITAETVKPPPKVDTEQAVNELTEQQEKLQKLQEEREKQKEEQAKLDEQAALKQKNCRISQDRLNNLLNTGTVRAIDEEGNLTRTTVEDHQARIDEVREKVKKYCE